LPDVLAASRSSARSAPISYTPPVKPPPPSTSAVLSGRGRRRRSREPGWPTPLAAIARSLRFADPLPAAFGSSLTTFPMAASLYGQLARKHVSALDTGDRGPTRRGRDRVDLPVPGRCRPGRSRRPAGRSGPRAGRCRARLQRLCLRPRLASGALLGARDDAEAAGFGREALHRDRSPAAHGPR